MLWSLTVSAQRAITFQDAEKEGLTVQKLDRVYANALDVDSAKSVFRGAGTKAFYSAYVALLQDVARYMKANNFTWGKPTRIVHRIYFEPDGTIDYYLLNLQPTGMAAETQAQFITLLNQFVKTYKLKITAGKKFAQCGPAIYQDAE
ncbi:hypothetical protein GCM10027037_18060 [Mucilaginibacter koreensis]